VPRSLSNMFLVETVETFETWGRPVSNSTFLFACILVSVVLLVSLDVGEINPLGQPFGRSPPRRLLPIGGGEPKSQTVLHPNKQRSSTAPLSNL
jgi:hypothetical protein